MKNIFYFLFYFIILSCAAQGPASGGHPDKLGPELISVFPINESKNISLDQKIILNFNELLDPISIPKSILINKNYKLKIKGRRIIIKPEKKWPVNQVLNIYFSRKIRDYQKNIMLEPIKLIYSTGDSIPNGQISGKIIGLQKDKLVEVGLFKYPINDSSNYLEKVETDYEGNFNFNFIDYGEYTIAAIESNLNNFQSQIGNKSYAMSTKNNIILTKEKSSKYITMLLSDRLEKHKITSIEMNSQYYVDLIMNDQSKESFLLDSNYSIGDTVKINMLKSNRLEFYHIPEYSFILPEITDTIHPKYIGHNFYSDSLLIIFSEPVELFIESILIKKDSIDIPIDFEMLNAHSIITGKIMDTTYDIKLLGNSIKDWSGNVMMDSILLVPIKKITKNNKVIIGGNILGTINYFDNDEIYVEAQNLYNNKVYGITAENKEFKLGNLESGLYKLWAFESLNVIDNSVYFSGTWNPYHRAARFTIYPDTIDVRARWDIEGIIIDFEQ